MLAASDAAGPRPRVAASKWTPAVAPDALKDESAAARQEASPALRVEPIELRREIRQRLAAGPIVAGDEEATLRLLSAHDAAFADAVAKLPERNGRGGAILGALIRETGTAVDPVALARMVAAALLLAPDESPDDDNLEALLLRIAELNPPAARELAAAHRCLGPRFALDNSLPVVLRKYGIRLEQLRPASYAARPRAGEVEQLLAEGRLHPLNDALRPFGVIVCEKIGSVAPVFRIDDRGGQRVMPAPDFIALLSRRAAVR